MSLRDQAKPVLDLIEFARGLDEAGKAKVSRRQIAEMRMKVAKEAGRAISLKEAEREIDNARVNVRRAADKADETLRRIAGQERLWNWTDPDIALRELRQGAFGGALDGLPWSDIEEGLRQKGNVLLIIAVYPALKDAIFARLSKRGVDVVQKTHEPSGSHTNE
jgi:hypothetical protein